MAVPTGGQESDQKQSNTMLPELNTQARNQGYATQQAESTDANVPRFGAAEQDKRIAIGSA